MKKGGKKLAGSGKGKGTCFVTKDRTGWGSKKRDGNVI